MDEKVILFGAGEFSKRAIKILGNNAIKYIVDNDERKKGKSIEKIPVYLYSEKKQELVNQNIVIATSSKYCTEIQEQLYKDGISSILKLGDIQSAIVKKKIENRFDYFRVYNKAINWIKKNSVDQKAIICNSELKKGYPEVTGYYIPTLIRWGYRELAINYANWLISIQKKDGSWYDTNDKAPYIFDSAQILKGLIAARTIMKDKSVIDKSIIRGCEWILSRMDENGRLVTPETECWGEDEQTCSEVIHLYCLSPIKEAGTLFDKMEYLDAADKIFLYYKEKYYDKIMNFSLLSHFYAYLMEALLDLGEIKMCREAMKKIADKQKISGAIPAYNNCDWVCSTGLFQLALVWFRLGENEKGNNVFSYACKLQNESGGWYGSYISEENPNEENTYFPTSEISWANKYFLDALYYKNKSEFDNISNGFMASIPKDDGRYLIVKERIATQDKKVLDVGCGKGRYLRNLLEEYPSNSYYGVDISCQALKELENMNVKYKIGTLTCIPYEDQMFDVTYTCEAMERAIDFENAIREMVRVTKKGGIIVVVDKNDECYGELEIGEWEKWPNEEKLRKCMLQFCDEVVVEHNLPYENGERKDLFLAWIGMVK